MQKADMLYMVVLFCGVAAVFVGVGVANHGAPWGWASLAGGVAGVLFAYRGLR